MKHLNEKYGVDVLEKRKNDVSGIHLASSNGDIDTVKYLLSKKANINEPSTFGFPINWAAGYN